MNIFILKINIFVFIYLNMLKKKKKKKKKNIYIYIYIYLLLIFCIVDKKHKLSSSDNLLLSNQSITITFDKNEV